MTPPADASRPLVIITSNVERQLPDAFLRRCVFFYIPFPSQKRLEDILNAHFPHVPVLLKKNALSLFAELRKKALRLTKKPATAELLDWLKALVQVFEPAEAERRLTEALAQKDTDGILWQALSALGCLLKLREDLETLGVVE